MGTKEGIRPRHQVRGIGKVPLRSTGWPILAGREPEILRRGLGKALSGVEEKSLLPDVNPRVSPAAGERRSQAGGKDERARVGTAGAGGGSAVRLCNLVAQSSFHAASPIQTRGG